ncbi:NitT/TauT family transport system substrate-binding protein [Tistlia consotensis]|uniref:NitT/TauT family transport system substrate-binding protein n=1 Tax=Tistlia consotensis USBA 355 TaxID=560819 RepID=A0A1Y6C5T5_9PROT|nr:putative urea ABC transporter substrate-binding protein [Tistlia consotensis]SMF36129.1 NitT/TauT family transport system substrate-binding protein [Tistlia consotensis USBA 355]SNR71476.1 NitT/TauT family transport system substrate-binding protein [Tistlia consotensis]
MRFHKGLIATVAAAALAVSLLTGGAAEAKTWRFAWNIYVGFMPYGWMQEHGILAKWAKKYGVDIQLIQVNDYVGGINQFTAGELDGMAVASMDGLTIPAAGGVDTTIMLVGDYSNGNDGILSRTADSVKDLKGQTVYLFELTVSHYLLSRALQMNGLDLPDVKTVNITDADIASAFIGSDEIKHAVTWNPMLQQMHQKVPGVKEIFDSSKIPEEIVDCMLMHTEDVKAHPEVAKALVGAWYETLAMMTSGTPEAEKMIADMADMSGGSVADFKAQLDDTFLYAKPADALDLMTSERHKKTWDFVRKFSYKVGLFGENAKNEDFVGIAFPDGSVLGDPSNVKLRIDPSFTEMAAKGQL